MYNAWETGSTIYCHATLCRYKQLAAPQLLHLEEEAEVLDRELAEGGVRVTAECRVRHSELLRLQLDDLVLDRVFDDELGDRHRAFLAETVNTV